MVVPELSEWDARVSWRDITCYVKETINVLIHNRDGRDFKPCYIMKGSRLWVIAHPVCCKPLE